MELESRIQGIPCRVRVDYYFKQKPLGIHCDSDLDALGYTDMQYTILDRKGYPASWLEKKMTDRDISQIEELIEYEHHLATHYRDHD